MNKLLCLVVASVLLLFGGVSSAAPARRAAVSAVYPIQEGYVDAHGVLIYYKTMGSGTPLLISVPRDSWVDIPGYGDNKINAAYDFGGPQLLARTIQNATGLMRTSQPP